MDAEIAALRAKDTMAEIPRIQVPKGKQVVKSTWVFRQKRRPSGEIYKLKARFVVRGDLQILDEPQSTFSPVVAWSTVRLLFVLTVAKRLRSTTIDFNNAFVQSTLPEPIYLELPPGYTSLKDTDHVYKVSKSHYGDVWASKPRYTHLCTILIKQLKFTISNVDSCLFFRNDIIFVFYVDCGPLNVIGDAGSIIRSTIFEDNQACYQLATTDPPRMTSRSKSIAIKYH
jgi:Reverse transcriptase (RNA-dependent DNA polymerase)